MSSIRNISILGERCSGTNYLDYLMLHNFNLKIDNRYHFKHFFGHSDYSNSDETLFITIIRDPLNWIGSLYENPYELSTTMLSSWDKFLTSEVSSWSDLPLQESEIMQDRDIESKLRHRDIFALRSSKIRFMIDKMDSLVRNHIVVLYEDLLNRMPESLDRIAERFGLQKPLSYQSTPFHRGWSLDLYKLKDYSQRVPPLVIRHIFEHVDQQLERRVKALGLK